MTSSDTQPNIPGAELDLLKKQAADSAGARFLKADLQVHTPRDGRWPGKKPTTDEERRTVAREYLAAAKERGIELVAITEHHDVSWIDELRAAAKTVGISLMPGFEVETKEGLHVLAIFDPRTPVAHLEDVLAQLGLTHEKRASTKITELRSDFGFQDVVRMVQDSKGICIAAHMTSDKGLLNLDPGGARADYWKCPDLFAGQTAVPPESVTPDGLRRIVLNDDLTYKRDRPLACVLTSDARSPEEIGTQATWIKMDRVRVEGLRQAFLDPESRISYEDPSARTPNARILAIDWAGGFLNGASVAFSPELTCLIGGKGAGKSTMIESVRFAFDLPSQTDVEEQTKTIRTHALGSGSRVRVLVETDGPKPEKFFVERTAPHAPVVRDFMGNHRQDLKPTQLFLPRLYGQKEVYAIAQSIQARLVLLDRFAEDDLREANESAHEVLRRLERNAQALAASRHQLDDIDAKLGELPGLEEWRRRFREAGFEEKLRERRELDRQERALTAADEALRERIRLLDSMRSDAAPFPASTADLTSNQDLLDHVKTVLGESESDWKTALDGLGKTLLEARERVAGIKSEWAERRLGKQAAFDAALRELQEKMPDVDPERYLDVERRVEQLSPLNKTRPRVVEQLDGLRKERSSMLVELQDVRAARFRAREAAAVGLTAATKDAVRVKVEYQSDRESLIEELGRQKTGARSDSLRRMVEHDDFSPAKFAEAVREKSLAGQFDLPDGQANALERGLSEESLAEIEIADLSDQVSIALDISADGNRDYRELDHLSPGQKSTAVLLLIMQASEDPLLVDQPEDDLDNRFIYDDIVQRLRDAKTRRQVVVATHNANIPVLGDAEQILVLDAKDGVNVTGEVVAHGSIDTDDVRLAVEHILEGGQEAFAQRRAKYGW